MGYAYYVINGRECGYAVEAICDAPGCSEEIDRGLAYLCGKSPGGVDDSCGNYFCGAHLYFADNGQRCTECATWDDEETD